MKAEDKIKLGEDHINRALRQVDPNTWLISNFLIRRTPRISHEVTWIDNGDNSSWTLTKAEPRLPSTVPLDTPFIKIVHEASEQSVVWAIGNSVLCKGRYIEERMTPEAVSINFVRDLQPSFGIPKIIHEIVEGDERKFLFLSRIPGRTLDRAWATLSEHWKKHYVKAVADVVVELAQNKGAEISGVDGQKVAEYYLAERKGDAYLDAVPENCKAVGFDCSDLVLMHTDMGPSNIIVEDEPMSGKIGIIDFEMCGYLPRDWIRVKFRTARMGAMALDHPGDDDAGRFGADVAEVLGEYGFNLESDGYIDLATRG